MTKTGLVLKLEGNTATILTPTGEFVKVTISEKTPAIGETYTGNLKIKHNYSRNIVAAIIVFFTFLLGTGTYGYCSTSEVIRISINPSVELKINYLGRVISASPLNRDGRTLLSSLQLKNQTPDEALTNIVKEAEKDNFIQDSYSAKGKNISVKIISKGLYKTNELNSFKKYISKKKINTTIDNNGAKSKDTYIKPENKTINNYGGNTSSNNKNGISTSSDKSHKSHEKKKNNSISDIETKKSKISNKAVNKQSKTSKSKKTSINKNKNTNAASNKNSKFPNSKEKTNTKSKNADKANSNTKSKTSEKNNNSSSNANKNNSNSNDASDKGSSSKNNNSDKQSNPKSGGNSDQNGSSNGKNKHP